MRPIVHALTPQDRPGPSVTFLHGLEDNWSSWLPVAEELPATWNLRSLELPWHAGNDYSWIHRPAGDWLHELLADPVPPDLIVAHSLGANALLTMAAQHALDTPLVLICPLYRRPEQPTTWAAFDQARRVFENHIQEGVLTRIGGRRDRLSTEVQAAIADLAIQRVGPTGFLTTFQHYVASGRTILEHVTDPTHIIAGSQDPTLSERSARNLCERIPNSSLDVINTATHFCHIQHAGRVAQSLGTFFDNQRGRTCDEVLAQ